MDNPASLQEPFSAEEFDVKEFLSVLVTGGDVKSQLEEGWQTVAQVKDIAVENLRENAFLYHGHILKAAEEIYAMEKGLENLRADLTEEQTTLERAMDAPAFAPTKERKSTVIRRKSRTARKSIFEYLSKIEGFNPAGLKERERYFLAKRNLEEYDVATLHKKHDLIVMLFSDCLILTLWTPHHAKNIHTEYKFLELVYLDKVEASIYKTTKDKSHLGLHIHVSLSFMHSSLSTASSHDQIMLFPFKLTLPRGAQEKIFDCATEEERSAWIEDINRLSGLLQEQTGHASHGRRITDFGESLDNILKQYRSETDNDVELLPAWFTEAGTDIMDDFEMQEYAPAVDRVLRAKRFWTDLKFWSSKKEYLDVYKNIILGEEKLCARLEESLRCSMDCPFGFDRSMCAELTGLLTKLNRKPQAGNIFLDHRSRLLSLALESIRPDETLTDFVRRSTDIFFDHISKSIEEFNYFGLNSDKNVPGLVGWVRFHINRFVDHMQRFIFSSHTVLSIAATTVAYVRTPAVTLSPVIGFDCGALIDACFEDSSIDYLVKQVEAFNEKTLALPKEKRNQLLTFPNREMALQYSKEVSEAGLGSLQPYLDGVVLSLPSKLIDFAKAFQQFAKHLCQICHAGMRRKAETLLSKAASVAMLLIREVMATHVRQDSKMSTQLTASLNFLGTNVFDCVESIFNGKFGSRGEFFSAEKEALKNFLLPVHGKPI